MFSVHYEAILPKSAPLAIGSWRAGNPRPPFPDSKKVFGISGLYLANAP
jgi:hypothetical protein